MKKYFHSINSFDGEETKKKVSNSQKKEFEKIQSLSKNQITRYGFFRSTDLRKEKVKKIIAHVNPILKNINSSDHLLISIKGLAKLFVGEVIERAKTNMYILNDSVDWIEQPVQKKSFEKCNKWS